MEVEIKHYKATTPYTLLDTNGELDDQCIQHGDSIVVEATGIDHSRLSGSSLTETSVGAARVQVTLPEGFDKDFVPEVFASASTDFNEEPHFQRVTNAVEPRLEQDPHTGLLYLIFAIIGTALRTVYEVVWVPAKAVGERFVTQIEQALNIDNERLYVRAHYRCNKDGYPCQLITVIGAGDPPAPEEEDDLEDGLFTAELLKGTNRLCDKFVSSRSEVVVKMEPFHPDSSTDNKGWEYKFHKQADSKCVRYYKVLVSTNSLGDAGSQKQQSALTLEIEKDKRNISGGSSVIAMKRQVCIGNAWSQ